MLNVCAPYLHLLVCNANRVPPPPADTPATTRRQAPTRTAPTPRRTTHRHATPTRDISRVAGIPGRGEPPASRPALRETGWRDTSPYRRHRPGHDILALHRVRRGRHDGRARPARAPADLPEAGLGRA